MKNWISYCIIAFISTLCPLFIYRICKFSQMFLKIISGWALMLNKIALDLNKLFHFINWLSEVYVTNHNIYCCAHCIGWRFPSADMRKNKFTSTSSLEWHSNWLADNTPLTHPLSNYRLKFLWFSASDVPNSGNYLSWWSFKKKSLGL